MMSKTVTVRIPVAMDRYGDVAVPECYSFYSDEEKLRRLHSCTLVNGVKIHWQEFEVPVPEPVEVEGRVE